MNRGQVGNYSVSVWVLNRSGQITYLSPISDPAERLFGLANALVVAVRHTPVISASRRPLPVRRPAHLVIVADLFDFGGVLDDAAVPADDVAEHVVPRSVAHGSPDRREAGVAHAADAAHYAVDVCHLEGDVVERRESGARVGDAVMHAVAAHEAHVARAVGEPEAELVDGEALGRIRVIRIQYHMRELDRAVALRGKRRHRRLDDEPIALAFRPLRLAPGADLGPRAAEGDAPERGRAALELDEVWQPPRAAQPRRGAIAHARKAPDLLEKARRAFDVGHAQFDALQFHGLRV